MSTAFNRPSMWKRVGALALAGTIALGTLAPGVGLVSADSGSPVTPTPSVTFDVPAGSGLTGLTAVVVAGGADLRQDPAASASVLARLPEGTIVDLRIDTADTVTDGDGVRWWPVTADGQDGWLAGNVLADASAVTPVPTAPATSTAPPTAAPTGTVSGGGADEEFDYTGEVVAGIQAIVAGDGSAVNMRAEATASSAIVAEVPDGSPVTLRIDTTDTVTDVNGTRWWPVTFDGKDGWIAGAYLRAAASPTPTVSPTATNGETEFVAGAYVRVRTDDGTGAILRAEPVPSGATVASWQEGQVAQVIAGPLSFEGSTRGWFKVSNGAVTGYVDGDLLVLAGPAPTTTTTPAVSPTAGPSGVFAPGDSAMVQTERGTGANLRATGDPAAESLGVVPEGATVSIVNGPASFTESTNGWFEVSYNGQAGYVDGDLLVKLASATVTPTPAVTATPGSTASAGQSGEDGSLRKGDTVTIASGGDGVNVRQSPADGSTIAGYLNDGATASIIDGPVKDDGAAYWYKVSDSSGVQGWVAGRYLVTGGTAPATEPVTPAPTAVATTPAPAAPTETVTAPAETVTATAAATTPPAAAPTATSGPAVSAQGFIYPLASYTVTQEFGCSYLGFYTYDPSMGCPVHDGLDLAAPEGTPIHAAKAGTVVAAGWCDCGLGYYVEIDHGGGVHTLYGHMQAQPWVSVGQQVAQGDEIGPLGSTGLSTGPHTHFMVTVDGVAQNPRSYLP